MNKKDNHLSGTNKETKKNEGSSLNKDKLKQVWEQIEKIHKSFWSETPEKRFLAYIDIMGFKDLVARENRKIIKNKMTKLSDFLQKMEKEEFQKNYIKFYFSILQKLPPKASLIKEQLLKSAKGKGDLAELWYFLVKPLFFSDTIMLFSSSDHPFVGLKLLNYCKTIYKKCINMGFPVKGVISKGLFTCDIEKSVYFGQPLIDAYELHKKLHYYGIILHNSFEKDIQYKKQLIIKNQKGTKIYDGNPIDLLIKYKTPFKKGKAYHFNLAPDFDSHIKAVNAVKKFYNRVSGETRIYVDNTLEFLDYVKEIHKKHKKKQEKQKLKK